MKTIIRNLKLWIIAVAAVASAACSDLLDQRPQGQWTIDDIEGGAYFSQVMALYTKARHYNITSGIPAFAVHYYRSEDSRKGSTTTDGAEHVPMYENFQYSAANSLLNPYWTQNYEIINAANTVLDQMQKAQEAAAQRTAPEVVGESASDLPSNDAPKWVETRYVGLGNEGDSATPEEQGTLYLPRILLDSPDGTAVNRLIQTWYEENQRDTKESGQTDALEADGLPIWDPMWDHTYGTLPIPGTGCCRWEFCAAMFLAVFMSRADGRLIWITVPCWITRRCLHGWGYPSLYRRSGRSSVPW